MPVRNFNDGQEIVFGDLNDISKAVLKDLYDRSLYELLSRKENAFFGDSFKVNYSNATTVIIKKGLGFQTLAVTTPEIGKIPVVLSSDISLTLAAAHATYNRIDLIIAKSSTVNDVTESRKFKNASSGSISTENFVVQKDFTSIIESVAGVPSVSPVAPSVPVGYVALAQILVTAVTGISGSGAITDLRARMPIAGDVEIDTTLYSRLTQSSSSKLSDILNQIDLLLPRAINTFTIANNQSSVADITGFTLDTSVGKSFTYKVDITRQVSGSQVRQFGFVDFIYNSVTNTWDIIPMLNGGDSGVEFSIVFVSGTQWKIQYVSSNIAGTSYSGTLKFQVKDIF